MDPAGRRSAPGASRGVPTGFVALLLALSVPVPALAYRTEPTTPHGQLVLVVLPGTEPASARRFAVELGLAVDGLAIARVPAPNPMLATMTTAQQMELLAPVVQGTATIAAIWFVSRADGQTAVELYVPRLRQVLVRTIDVRDQVRPEVNLALAARSLLVTSYLFGPPELAVPPPGLAAEIAELRAGMSPAAGGAPSVELGVAFMVGSNATDSTGPARVLGGRLDLDWLVSPDWLVGVVGSGRYGPERRGRDHRVGGWGGALAAVLARRLDLSWAETRLGAGVGVDWQELTFRYATGRRFRFHDTRFVAAAGPAVSVPLAQHWALIAGAQLRWTPQRRFYWRYSTGRVVFSTPAVGWETNLGLSWSGW